MGLGEFFTRNLDIEIIDTVTGDHQGFEVITDVGGSYSSWDQGAYRGGMAIPGAWRAAVLLSDLIGSIPWHSYRDGEREALLRPVLEQPAPPDTRMTSFSSLALDLIWHGNAFGVIADRDPDGVPTSVVPVSADYVQAWRIHATDRPELGLRPGQLIYTIAGLNFLPEDVMHVKGPCYPGALRGFGVLENHLHHTLKLARTQASQAGDLGLAAVPTGVLTSANPDMTATEAAAIKAAWQASQSSRTVAVLNATTAFAPLSWNPSETQLLDARKFTLSELALIFGLPASFLGAEIASRTYSNAENESLNLIKFSLAGHLGRIEQAFSLLLPEGEHVRANLDSLLRADTLSRYQAHQIGIMSGFLTDDEARELEGRPPLTAEQRAQLAPPAPPMPVTTPSFGPKPAPGPSATPPPGPSAVRGRGKGGGGGDESDLFVYWTEGAGKAKWATAAEPLVALYDQLVAKGMTPERARETALAWLPDGLGRPVKKTDGTLPT